MDAIIAMIKENVKGDQIAALVLAALILLATAVISHVITRLLSENAKHRWPSFPLMRFPLPKRHRKYP